MGKRLQVFIDMVGRMDCAEMLIYRSPEVYRIVVMVIYRIDAMVELDRRDTRNKYLDNVC
jgi:hypothetical protein